MRFLKISLLALLVLVIATAAWIGLVGNDLIRTATNSASHSLCASAFLARIDPDRTFGEEQLPLMGAVGRAIHYDVDRRRREVRTTFLGGFAARAVFRDGLGCLLAHGDGPVPEAAGFQPDVIAGGFAQTQVVEATDRAIRKALDQAFAEPDPAHPRLTKAVVVLHDGKLIAERYAPGYGPDTPIYAHSLTKSVVNALIGILVRQGKLQLDQPAPIAAWRSPSDPHHAVTLDQLLRMDSGLPFDETAGALSPMAHMLFLESDMAGYAAAMPLAHPPGTVWGYSNFSYLLLGRVVRDAAGGNAVDAERFARRELFGPLGMRDTVIETDATGTPVGASNVYASARDFARFGQLYLDDGVVDGRRILPEGWVAYSHSQTLKTGYGAGFWTNLVSEGSVPVWDAPWGMPRLPKDMYYARGAFGQYVVIVPSEHLVVVRMGISLDYGTGTEDMIVAIIDALHHQPRDRPAVAAATR
ncbi:serine hydrolase domain-containing protein [Rhodanobacter sp. Col0626]|uniref:serine hydrolase domain-containing protein n=1 Tax=Rhodanobacter sp. Col0626 TaxID=3415679 RepID=UPI003CFB3A4A